MAIEAVLRAATLWIGGVLRFESALSFPASLLRQCPFADSKGCRCLLISV